MEDTLDKIIEIIKTTLVIENRSSMKYCREKINTILSTQSSKIEGLCDQCKRITLNPTNASTHYCKCCGTKLYI